MSNMTNESNVSNVSNVSEVSEVSDVWNVSDLPNASNVSKVSNMTNVSNGLYASGVPIWSDLTYLGIRTALVVLVIAGGLLTGCSSYEMNRLKRMNFTDDLYTDADALRTGGTVLEEEGSSPYDSYLGSERRGRRYGRSGRLNRYDPDYAWAGRFGNPLWSNPGWNYGMGGFYGCRSYMLYNPFMPSYWGMNPGFSMGWGSPYGMHRPFGYDPWMYGGAGWGMYDPWGWNSWNSPWCSNWGMNSYWGWNNGWNYGWNGWNHGGTGIWVSAAPSLKPSPTRSSLPGSSLPGYVHRGRMRAPARVPNSMAGGGFTGRLAEKGMGTSRSPRGGATAGATTLRGRNGIGPVAASPDRETPATGVVRNRRSTQSAAKGEVRYPYASPGTGQMEEGAATRRPDNPYNAGGTSEASDSYMPSGSTAPSRYHSPSRTNSTGTYPSGTPSTGSYDSYRSNTPSRTSTPDRTRPRSSSSDSYEPTRSTTSSRSYSPSRSSTSGGYTPGTSSSGSYSPTRSTTPSRTYSPSRSSTSGGYTPRPSSSGSYSPSRTYTPSRSSTSGGYTPRSSGSNYSPSSPSRSSSPAYSRPSSPSGGGSRYPSSSRPR